MTGKNQRCMVGFLTGVLLTAILLGGYSLRHIHHYSELGTFYRGTLDDRQVIGIAYIEYDGWGFMELTQWKVQLISRSGEHMTLYKKSAVFQEKTPHQPKIEVSGHQIRIDDGVDQIVVDVQQSPKV